MRSNFRGFMTIELLASLAIGSLMLVGLTSMVDASLEDTRGQQAAYYHSQIVDAANKYIKANYSTFATAANTASTTAVPLQTLKAANLLSPGTGATNSYGQTPCLLIRATSKMVGGQPVYFLNALVVTEGTAAQAIPDRILHAAAAQSGTGGGAISTAAPSVASGSYGTWKLSETTSPKLSDFLSARCSAHTAGAGSFASALFYDGPGQLSTDFLYRNAVPGRPELNQMNAPLRMSVNAVVNENDACGASAAIAVDAARNLMNCDLSGQWKRVTTWKQPVASYDDLPGVTTATTDAVGDVRMALDSGRAFMYAGGAGWVALAVDQNGNLSVPGNIEAQYGHIWAKRSHVTAGMDVVAGRDLIAGHNMYASNDANVQGNANVGNYVTSTSVYAVRNVMAGMDINAGERLQGRSIYAAENVYANTDVIAARDVIAGRFVSAHNGADINGLYNTYGGFNRFPSYVTPDHSPPQYILDIQPMLPH